MTTANLFVPAGLIRNIRSCKLGEAQVGDLVVYERKDGSLSGGCKVTARDAHAKYTLDNNDMVSFDAVRGIITLNT